jgi:hypothetical protein
MCDRAALDLPSPARSPKITPFRRVEGLYYDYIRSQRTEVQSMLDRIAAMPVTSNRPADE